jgi:hypothetical protein
MTPDGDVIFLKVREGDKTREVALEGKALEKHPGAADVLAALSE